MNSSAQIPRVTSNTLERLFGLMQRDMKTRHAGGALGYLWAFVTPIAWIAFVVILFHILNRRPPIAVAPEVFIAAGILPYVLFRQILAVLMRTVSVNRFMLYYHPTSNGEILLATALVELLSIAVISALIFAPMLYLFSQRQPDNLFTVILALALTWIIGFGFGRFCAILGLWSDSIARVIAILMRPMFWISGVFYTATELPEVMQYYLWYNPLFHCIELLREGFFLGYRSSISSHWYPLFCGLLFFLISIPLENYVKITRQERHRL